MYTPRTEATLHDTYSTIAGLSIRDRLGPTRSKAEEELLKARIKTRWTNYTINAAIGAQVVLGSVTTGVSAATTGRATSLATSVLGAFSTFAASYLAKTRGSGGPEISHIRAEELKHFLRDLDAFMMDKGHLSTEELDEIVAGYRKRFEEIMGHDKESVGQAAVGKGGKDKLEKERLTSAV